MTQLTQDDIRSRLIRLFKQLIPINTLTEKQMGRLAETVELRQYPADARLFHEGDQDSYAVFLLKGKVDILTKGKVEETIESGSFPARYQLAPGHPRRSTAVCRTPVRILRLDNALLDVLLTWQQSSSGEIGLEGEEGDDWVTRMLQLTLFQKLPPDNLQKVIQRMQSVHVNKGETIIRQGDEGDFYYVIRQGRCEVARIGSDGRRYKLAELAKGDSFGEESLVSGSKRNANVTMLSNGIVMRLMKEDFIDLIQSPLGNEVDYYLAESLSSEGAKWLDVRLPEEFKKSHFTNATNLPLPLLRKYQQKLDKKQRYIAYCDTGRRSATAAFLLQQEGFDVQVLSGGLQALPAGVILSSAKPEPEKENWMTQTMIGSLPVELQRQPPIREGAPNSAELEILAKQLADTIKQRDAALAEVKKLKKEIQRLQGLSR